MVRIMNWIEGPQKCREFNQWVDIKYTFVSLIRCTNSSCSTNILINKIIYSSYSTDILINKIIYQVYYLKKEDELLASLIWIPQNARKN